MTMIDHQQLDARLCEALEITAVYEICFCGHDRSGHEGRCVACDDMIAINPCQCTEYRERARFYPGLSTSGNGMLLLMQALRRRDMVWFTEFCGDQIFACVFKPEPDGEPMTQYGDEEPITLALAAAQALGIKVPQ